MLFFFTTRFFFLMLTPSYYGLCGLLAPFNRCFLHMTRLYILHVYIYPYDAKSIVHKSTPTSAQRQILHEIVLNKN